MCMCLNQQPSDVYLSNSTTFRTTMASETILTPHHKLSKHNQGLIESISPWHNIVFVNCCMSANVQVVHVATSRIIILVCLLLHATCSCTSGLNGLDLSLFLCSGPSPVSGLS